MMSSFKPLIAVISSDLFILFDAMKVELLWLIVGLSLRGTLLNEDEENVGD
jgi:hypothetical protein